MCPPGHLFTCIVSLVWKISKSRVSLGALTKEQRVLHIKTTLVTADDATDGHVMVDAHKNLLARTDEVQLVPLTIVDARYIEG